VNVENIYETDIGVIAFPNLCRPVKTFRGGVDVKPFYSCMLQTDFPEGIVSAAQKVTCKPVKYWPVSSNQLLLERTKQPTWFKWKMHTKSDVMVPCMDVDDRLIPCTSVRAGDRVRLGVTFWEYTRKDTCERGVAAKLRYVRRVGGPIMGEDV
jgi:hypothetical protein